MHSDRSGLLAAFVLAGGCGSGAATSASSDASAGSDRITEQPATDAMGGTDSSDALSADAMQPLGDGGGDAGSCPYEGVTCSPALACTDDGGYPPCTLSEALALACSQHTGTLSSLATCTGELSTVSFFGTDTGVVYYYSTRTGSLAWSISTGAPSPTASCHGANPPPCVSCTDTGNPCGNPGDAEAPDVTLD